MGIYDRDYSRNSGRDRLGPGGPLTANAWIILINVVVHAARVFLGAGDPLAEYGHFSYFEVTWDGGLEFWRFLTFQFLHADIVHIFFNMLGLYMFGGLVEQHLGFKRYLAFYLTCGIFGGLGYLLLYAFGVLGGDPRIPLVGASAGVFGVIMAAAYIAPDLPVQLIFPPIPMRMKVLAYAYVGIAVLTIVFSGPNAGGEAAHLGGAIAGFFFIRRSHLLRDFFDVFSDSRKEKRAAARAAKRKPARPPEEDRKVAAEMDRILDKVKTQGLHTLTDQERDFLNRETDRMRKRGL